MPGGSALPLVADTTTVSSTAATGVAVTLTLPAAGASLFIYLCNLEITMFFTATNLALATPTLVTTTGITGTPTFSFAGQVGVVGVVDQRIYNNGGLPLKGSAANTALTVVCPAVTGLIWRVNGTYFTAP